MRVSFCHVYDSYSGPGNSVYETEIRGLLKETHIKKEVPQLEKEVLYEYRICH